MCFFYGIIFIFKNIITTFFVFNVKPRILAEQTQAKVYSMRELFNMFLFLALVKLDELFDIVLINVDYSDIRFQMKALKKVSVQSSYIPPNRSRDYNELMKNIKRG